MELLIKNMFAVHGTFTRRSGRVIAALALAVSLGGCSQVIRPEQADQGEQADLDTFLHDHLQRQAMVTVAEAYRAVLVLAEGDDNYEAFADRQAALEERGIVRPAWGLQRDQCIDRGSVAYMVCRVLEIRGGVNLRLFGGLGLGDRRYALRELLYRDMMPRGAVYRYMTGGELTDLIRKADDYMAKHDMYPQEAAETPEIVGTDVPGQR